MFNKKTAAVPAQATQYFSLQQTNTTLSLMCVSRLSAVSLLLGTFFSLLGKSASGAAVTSDVNYLAIRRIQRTVIAPSGVGAAVTLSLICLDKLNSMAVQSEECDKALNIFPPDCFIRQAEIFSRTH